MIDYSVLDNRTLAEIRAHWHAEKQLCKKGDLIEPLADEKLSLIDQEIERRKR